MFHTLMYAKKLEEAGVSRQQAEAHVQIIAEIVEGSLATKQDVQDLKREIQGVKEGLEHTMLEMEYRMTIKLGTIVTIAIAAATAVIKLL